MHDNGDVLKKRSRINREMPTPLAALAHRAAAVYTPHRNHPARHQLHPLHGPTPSV